MGLLQMHKKLIKFSSLTSVPILTRFLGSAAVKDFSFALIRHLWTKSGRYFFEMLALKMRRNAYEVFVFDLARLLLFISEQSVSECTIAQLQTSLYSRHGMNIGRWLIIVFTNF